MVRLSGTVVGSLTAPELRARRRRPSRMRRASTTSSALSIVLASLVLTSCGVLSGSVPTGPSPTSSPTVWTPAGAEPAVTLTSPGDGRTRTVRVGDRVRLPRTHDFGGLRLKSWRGMLVPYGDDRTYLAVGTGRVPVEDTVYDDERPCVPPQPVAEFDLVIAPGAAPPIPAPESLRPETSTTVTLAPGQELTYPDGWSLHGVTSADPVVSISQRNGTYGLRPGTVRLRLSPPRDSSGRSTVRTVRVHVVDPASDTPTTDPSTPTALTGAPGDAAAAPRALPVCA